MSSKTTCSTSSSVPWDECYSEMQPSMADVSIKSANSGILVEYKTKRIPVDVFENGNVLRFREQLRQTLELGGVPANFVTASRKSTTAPTRAGTCSRGDDGPSFHIEIHACHLATRRQSRCSVQRIPLAFRHNPGSGECIGWRC